MSNNPKITHDKAVVPDWEGALVMARLAYSPAEQANASIPWLRAMHHLNVLRETPIVVCDGETPPDYKFLIGEVLTSVTYLIANLRTDRNVHPKLFKVHQWQQRGPDVTVHDAASTISTFAHAIGQMAKYGMSIMGHADNSPACMAAKKTLCTTLMNPTETNCLFTLASYHKLSLRECMEASLLPRLSKIRDNTAALAIRKPGSVRTT